MFGQFTKILKNLDTDSLVEKAAPMLDKVLGGAAGNNGGGQSQPPARAPIQREESYAHLNGKRKALLIGINYTGQKGTLRGCHADVENMKKYLDSKNAFHEYRVMLDSPQISQDLQPTRQNMINQFKWLVKDAQPGDSFFLHYSGHGANQKDTDGDEADGYDETLVPLDYQQSGMIVDDDLNTMLVKTLPKGCKLTAVFDCCHSGSVLDLPFTYSVDGNNEITFRDNRKEGLKAGLNSLKAFAQKDHQRAMQEAFKAVSLFSQKEPQADNESQEKNIKDKGSEATVLMFSGCQDSQTSADANIDGSFTGAMSWSLLKVLYEQDDIPLNELLRRLRGHLHGKYEQIPQMSTCHEMDVVNMKFSLTH